MYYIIALSNPGRLIGSQAEVRRKATAYNPEHYHVDKNDAGSCSQSPKTQEQSKHERKVDLLTRGYQLNRHDRPKTPTQTTLPTSQAFASQTQGPKSDPFELLETSPQLVINKDAKGDLVGNQRRIAAIEDRVDTSRDEQEEEKRHQAFQMI